MTDPNAAKFIFQQGVRCLESRDFEAAVALFDDAVKLTPNHADAWACRALALGHLKRYAESIDSFDKAVELNPDDIRIWLNRGIALSEWGQQEKAIAICYCQYSPVTTPLEPLPKIQVSQEMQEAQT